MPYGDEEPGISADVALQPDTNDAASNSDVTAAAERRTATIRTLRAYTQNLKWELPQFYAAR